MSVNINVTLSLPLQVVAAIKNRDKDAINMTGLKAALIRNASTVMEAVDAIPYNIAPEQASQRQLRNGSAQKDLTVDIQTVTGKTIRIRIDHRTTVNDLVLKIQDAEGIPPSAQELVFAGRQLQHSHGKVEDDEDTIGTLTLAECGIQPGSTIDLVLNLRGS